ncbi:VOC family protein [Nigerium massiliense]|uniref:VOC family protein n=1 Tax=Nigerium massiliense TaxID=1522317 RepID=UPI0005906302|nr:VOC family protein [Nigerium massiliense]
MTKPQLFSCLRYADANAGLAFLLQLGFTERLVVRDEDDPTVIHHAQVQWRDNGGLMFGSDREGGIGPKPGTACVNLVVASDDEVNVTLARALEAGGRQLDEISEPDHGGRSVAVADPEGNIFNIDSYEGE